MGLRSFIAGSALVQGLTNVREALPTELFPGVEKPSVTLAHMLCAEMLQHLDAKTVEESGGSTRFKYYIHTFPSVTLRVMAHIERDYINSEWVDRTEYTLSRVTLKDVTVSFNAQEQAILLEGWKKFWKLRSTYESVKREETRQHTALSAIETFFKPKETPCVELKPVAANKSKTDAGPPPSALDALLSPVVS